MVAPAVLGADHWRSAHHRGGCAARAASGVRSPRGRRQDGALLRGGDVELRVDVTPMEFLLAVQRWTNTAISADLSSFAATRDWYTLSPSCRLACCSASLTPSPPAMVRSCSPPTKSELNNLPSKWLPS